MPDITWEAPYCADADNCFRLGTDGEGNAYIAVSGAEDRYLTDSREALRTLIPAIRSGEADHLR